MIQVNVTCPACKASLMDKSHLLLSAPTIHTRTTIEGQEVSLRLSSILGDYTIDCPVEIPEGVMVTLHCPHCAAPLIGDRTCNLCSAPMASFIMREGGGIQICCRRGCKRHVIEFENPETEVSDFYRNHPIFWDAYHALDESDN